MSSLSPDLAQLAQDCRREHERLERKYDDLPREAILKEDLLRTGIAFSSEALRFCSEFKTKSYFIFSFDMVSIESMGQEENLKAPEEIRYSGGA